MMRFPLRLTSHLVMAWLAQKLRLAQGTRPIQFVDAAEMLHPDSSHPVSHEKIRAIIGSPAPVVWIGGRDRKSTRLNSSHQIISYAVFCLKKKNEPLLANRPATPISRTHDRRVPRLPDHRE